MTLPFTVAQFLEVFERDNQVVWPAQIVAYLAGLGIIALIDARSDYAGRIGAAVLAFGGLFILQAVLILGVSTR